MNPINHCYILSVKESIGMGNVLVAEVLVGTVKESKNGVECKEVSDCVIVLDDRCEETESKSLTYEDDLYMNERKTENSEMGSAILKFDIWKWPKRKKRRYTNCKSKSRRWKFDIWRWPNKKRGKWKESRY
nr:hypothetical protein [Tanacetum cinerariifolium]